MMVTGLADFFSVIFYIPPQCPDCWISPHFRADLTCLRIWDFRFAEVFEPSLRWQLFTLWAANSYWSSSDLSCIFDIVKLQPPCFKVMFNTVKSSPNCLSRQISLSSEEEKERRNQVQTHKELFLLHLCKRRFLHKAFFTVWTQPSCKQIILLYLCSIEHLSTTTPFLTLNTTVK